MNPVVQLQKAGIGLARILPLKIADRIAAGLGLLFCYLNKRKRGYIKKNLEYIFHDQRLDRRVLNEYVKRTFINFARAMVDFLRLSHLDRDDFDVEPVGIEHAQEALQYNRGCVLLTLHLGNWDYAGAYLAANDVPMSALVEMTEPEMYELYTSHRERTGMVTFPLDKAGYAFLHAIKNNRVLAVLADRDIMHNGVTVDFFSGKRKIPRGLAEIVIRRKMPVVVAYIAFNPKSRKQRYIGVVEEPLVFSGTSEEFQKFMVSRFEEIIRRYPDQWFVFHPEWLE